MRSNYDFSRGVRGKYAKQFQAGTNLAVIEADLIKYFPDSASVNHALRAIVAAVGKKHRATPNKAMQRTPRRARN
jgi:hypothetical protein